MIPFISNYLESHVGQLRFIISPILCGEIPKGNSFSKHSPLIDYINAVYLVQGQLFLSYPTGTLVIIFTISGMKS